MQQCPVAAKAATVIVAGRSLPPIKKEKTKSNRNEQTFEFNPIINHK